MKCVPSSYKYLKLNSLPKCFYHLGEGKKGLLEKHRKLRSMDQRVQRAVIFMSDKSLLKLFLASDNLMAKE